MCIRDRLLLAALLFTATNSFAPLPLLDSKSGVVLQASSSAEESEPLLERMVVNAETDPYLDGILEPRRQKKLNRIFMDKEAHRHDSLLHEIQHAIENDPDLMGVTQAKASAVNEAYMEKELHRHDSYWNEIEHAVDTDPYLSTM